MWFTGKFKTRRKKRPKLKRLKGHTRNKTPRSRQKSVENITIKNADLGIMLHKYMLVLNQKKTNPVKELSPEDCTYVVSKFFETVIMGQQKVAEPYAFDRKSLGFIQVIERQRYKPYKNIIGLSMYELDQKYGGKEYQMLWVFPYKYVKARILLSVQRWTNWYARRENIQFATTPANPEQNLEELLNLLNKIEENGTTS